VKADGTLSLPTNTIPIQNAFFSLSLWPWGTDIAMASAMPSPNLLAFPLSADGSIAASGFLFGNATSSGGVAIDPSGQFAFASDSSQGVVYTYSRSAAGWGLLTYQPPPPASPYTSFAAGAGAGPIVTDPSGLLVYVANQVDNTISAYQYWGTGAELFESKGQFVSPYSDGSPFAVGVTPISMAIDPNGAFLYVLCGDGSLRTFAIDYYSGGHLARIGSVTLSGQPSGLTVDATGKYVYASRQHRRECVFRESFLRCAVCCSFESNHLAKQHHRGLCRTFRPLLVRIDRRQQYRRRIVWILDWVGRQPDCHFCAAISKPETAILDGSLS